MTILAQVTVPANSGLPEDASVMTFHFNSVKSDTQGALIVGNLTNFFNTANITRPVAAYFSPDTNQSAWGIKLYDLADALPRVPFVNTTFNPADSANSVPLPSEVAICLSYQAAAVSGANQARRRGRVFLGPLNTIAAGTTVNGNRPNSQAILDIKTAAARLKVEANADAADWVVYSKTAGTSALVANGWVDDAFDTIRKRGLAPTGRTTWT